MADPIKFGAVSIISGAQNELRNSYILFVAFEDKATHTEADKKTARRNLILLYIGTLFIPSSYFKLNLGVLHYEWFDSR